MDIIWRAICFGVCIGCFVFSCLLQPKWVRFVNFIVMCLAGAILLLGIYL